MRRVRDQHRARVGGVANRAADRREKGEDTALCGPPLRENAEPCPHVGHTSAGKRREIAEIAGAVVRGRDALLSRDGELPIHLPPPSHASGHNERPQPVARSTRPVAVRVVVRERGRGAPIGRKLAKSGSQQQSTSQTEAQVAHRRQGRGERSAGPAGY